MVNKKTEMLYDSEEDILFLSKGKQVKESIDIGDFILDIDHNNLISGIEILNASQNLNIEEKQLENIKIAAMKVTYKPNNIIITLLLQTNNKEKDISIPLAIDLGHSDTKTQETNFAIA